MACNDACGVSGSEATKDSAESAAEQGEEWLDAAAKLAKSAVTRSRTFDDPSFLSRAVETVNKVAHEIGSSGTITTTTAASLSSDGTDQDSAFEAPSVQAPPKAARVLGQLFTVLRNSCAGCPTNTRALRHTGLAEAALQFAVDQAPFACGAESQPSALAGDGRVNDGNVDRRTGDSSDTTTVGAASAAVAAQQEGDAAAAVIAGGGTSAIRLAVRAGLQFVCNFCVGNEESKALLWDAWFPRGLMELVNGLKTDRGLLSLAVAFVHNCCLSSPPCGRDDDNDHGGGGGGSRSDHENRRSGGAPGMRGVDEGGEEERQGDKGRERLGQLAADRAFCCLLMKVVVPQSPIGSVCVSGDSIATNMANATGASKSVDHDRDPAAEWLYLLFCRFVNARLCRNVFDNVGVRAGGRQRWEEQRRRQRKPQGPGEEDGWSVEGGGGEGVEAVEADSQSNSRILSGDQDSRNWEGEGGHKRREATGEHGEEEEKEGEEEEEEEEDFFFPVTPEQLIALNLAEVAAGDEIVTGGKQPDSKQLEACDTIVSWLTGLLSAMPLSQSLRPRARSPAPMTAEASSAQKPPRHSASSSTSEATVVEDEDDGTDGGFLDQETDQVRRSMLEEARSAALRALAVLLAGCSDESRRVAATWMASLEATTWDKPAAVGGTAAATGWSQEEEELAGVTTFAEKRAEAASAAVFSVRKSDSLGCAVATEDTAGVCDSSPRSPATAPIGSRPLTRLIPLCLRLLHGCGVVVKCKHESAAKPKGMATPRGGSTTEAAAATAAAVHAGIEAQNVAGRARQAVAGDVADVPGDVPAGRKVELLKVIGNACFRCPSAQDSVREEGGLPLVLNHCTVDGQNPYLREYALLAVRNLCEGNPANQASIAALQPQGCTPGMDEALADMGLEGHMDMHGRFRVGPRAAAVPPSHDLSSAAHTTSAAAI